MIFLVAASYARSPDSPYAFADALFKDGDYYRAITEYYRCKYLNHDIRQIYQADIGIAKSYLYGQDIEKAIILLENIKKECTPDFEDIYIQSQFLRAECAAYTYDYDNEIQFYNTIIIYTANTNAHQEALKRLVLASIKHGKYERSLYYMQHLKNTISEENSYTTINAFEKEIIQGAPHLKSPGFAVFLSVIPGLGEIYAGKIIPGLITLVSNTAQITIITCLYAHGDLIPMYFFLIGEMTWYTHNFKRAYNTVQSVNNDRNKEYAESLQIKYPLVFYSY